MKQPSRETIERLKTEYPEGAIVELITMSDDQAPPAGTLGLVSCVDDMGTIHVLWENSSSLGIAYGEDRCRRIK